MGSARLDRWRDVERRASADFLPVQTVLCCPYPLYPPVASGGAPSEKSCLIRRCAAASDFCRRAILTVVPDHFGQEPARVRVRLCWNVESCSGRRRLSSTAVARRAFPQRAVPCLPHLLWPSRASAPAAVSCRLLASYEARLCRRLVPWFAR